MLFRYDLARKTYHRFDLQDDLKYNFPSFCDNLNGSVFFSGGLANSKNLDPVSHSFMVETVEGKVTQAEGMIIPRYKHQLIFCNRAVYALGGYSKNRMMTSKVERYDFTSGEWEGMPKMYHERQSFFAVPALGSRSIYVTGGCRYETNNPLIERFDTVNEIWIILEVKMQTQLNEFHHIMAVMEGGIEIFGKDYDER